MSLSSSLLHDRVYLNAEENVRQSTGSTPIFGYTVVESYPHATDAFTQGFVVDSTNAVFFESTGLIGSSSLRRVDISSGTVLNSVSQQAPIFSEGIAIVGDTIIQLTWTNEIAYFYDKATLSIQKTVSYDGEGWGLTYDGRNLIMSNGTSTLKYLDPSSFRVLSSIEVEDNGQAIINLNELEYVNGEIYANIWKSDLIARINPSSGKVNSYIDLSGIHHRSSAESGEDVLNGIAWDSLRKKLYVTGKRWDKVYNIAVDEEASSSGRLPVSAGSVNSGLSTEAAGGGGGCLLKRLPRFNK